MEIKEENEDKKTNDEKAEKVEVEIEQSDAPKGGLKMRIYFIFFGIGSLLAWNAILSDIGFFIHYQAKYSPATSFSFCNFALNIVFQFIMIFKKQLISFKMQLLFGLIASIISIVILPIIVVLFEKDSLIGFIITAALILFQGLVNALCCNGFFGLASFFPMEQIISLSAGQGISGILMNIIGYIVIAAVNTGDKDKDAKVGAIIFFSISGFILLVCLIILLNAFKTEYFKHYLSKTKDFSQIDINAEKVGLLTKSNETEDLLENENDKEISFWELSKLLKEIDFLACFLYLITFSLFPSCSINQRLFEFGDYRQTTIITFYNVFDTVGRFIVSKIEPTKKKSYIIILSRTILLFTFMFVFYCDRRLNLNPIVSSILLMINVITLAITNGIGASLCLGIAPTLVPDELKGRAGGSVGFFNIFGIFLGTCFAFLTSFLMGKIGVYQ